MPVFNRQIQLLRRGGVLMKKPVIVFAGIFFLLLGLFSSGWCGALDGKSYSGKTGELGKKINEDEVIKFENGKFTSVGCAEWGFGSGPYMTEKQGDRIFFVADTFSEKYGRISWSGVVSGKDAHATYVWYDNNKFNKPEQVKWFEGTMK